MKIHGDFPVRQGFSQVHHVVMYDFPLNMADYLHRVGRTARGGRAGRVTTITPRRYWPFVAKIQEIMDHRSMKIMVNGD
jgi:superfamily II DNA/RNA helicase